MPRSDKRAAFVELVLGGMSPMAAGSALGISERSVRRFTADPRTRAELGAARQARLAQLSDKSAALASRGLEVLAEVAEGGEVESARVSAAAKLLDAHLRLLEVADLGSRLSDLEARMAAVGREVKP